MRFTFNAINYLLEFERQYRNVTVYKDTLEPQADGSETRVKKATSTRSQYPFTYAKLLEIRPDKAPIKIAEGVVGCMPGDVFSYASGRQYALRALSSKLRRTAAPKALIAAVWTAYLTRNTRPTKPVEAVTEAATEAPATEAELT